MVEKEFEKDFFSYRSGYPRTFGMYVQSMTWGRHLESSWNYASDRLDLTVVVLAYWVHMDVYMKVVSGLESRNDLVADQPMLDGSLW